MNNKAKSFKEFLDEHKIECYEIIETKDEFKSVVFRSNIEIEGQNLPMAIILDDTIYGMVQVLMAPKALKETNEVELLKYINEQNRFYKPFKYSFDPEGNLVLEISMLCREDKVEGEFVYVMLEVLANHLNETYADLMKKVWA